MDVREDTVSKECEDDEVDRGKHATANTPLRLDPMIHHSIPVLASQNLRGTKKKKATDILFCSVLI